MNIQATLLSLFPDAQEGSWTLRNDGAGPYISAWNLSAPCPTPEALAQQWATIQATYETQQALAARDEARRARYIAESDPLHFKALRGEIPMSEAIAKVAQIRAEIP